MHPVPLDGEAADALGLAEPGACYLVRPDGHIAARWQHPSPGAISAGAARMMGH